MQIPDYIFDDHIHVLLTPLGEINDYLKKKLTESKILTTCRGLCGST